MNLSRVAIAGATGYAGQELVSLLAKHPYFKLVARIGREDKLSDLKGKADIVFLCTPNETSLEMAPPLLDMGLHVIDVSGAFRLKKHSYPQWYGFEHTASKWLEKSEYGLFPWNPLPPVEVGQARLIANPGCFTTAALMAMIPMLRSGLVDPASFVIDAKSGTTGAGRKGEVRLLFSELYGEFAPYKVGKHQHWPEIVEYASLHGQMPVVDPVFITELLPVPRGISAAVFARWKSAPDLGALLNAFKGAYGAQPDITVSADPAHASMKAVVGTNRIHFCLQEAFGKPVVFSVIDNLLRGAAGQALLNANQLAGRPAQEGL